MSFKNKLLLVVSSVLIIAFPVLGTELSPTDYQKLDATLALMLERPELRALVYTQMTGTKFTETVTELKVLIKTTLTESVLNKFGVTVQGRIGDIVAAIVPIDQIKNLVTHPEIIYIQGPRMVTIQNDVSVPEIGATRARQQYNLTGKGVIIGIIDTGIDWRHLDFRNSDGTTRIKALLDLSERGPDKAGGTWYTEQEINNALNGIGTVNEKDVVGHGTHVAGSAAGNGRATGNGIPANTYIGVAPEADLVIVKANRVEGISFDRNDYVPSMVFIRDIANSLNKPYIINISSGGNFGPHDGTDAIEQAIDNLLNESNSKCKAVVIAAGNNANQNIHASGTLSRTVSNIETQFTIPSYTPQPDKINDYVEIEGWYQGLYNLSVKVITPGGKNYGPISSGNEAGFDTDEGVINILNAKGGPSALNGDKQVLIQVFDYFANKPPKQGVWKVIFYGSAGRFDLWLTGSSMEASFSSNIDPTMITGTPGTAVDAITVGSYVTKKIWTDLDGNRLQYADLVVSAASSFSSPGPTRDGRVKPELCAPGEVIAATYSADAPPKGEYSLFQSSYPQWPNAFICRDGKHAITQGTSMATPHVAGTIALMVQQNPSKTSAEIKQAIIATARKDSYTGTVPNNKWGYGKLDAFAVLQRLAVIRPVSENYVPETIELHQNYPNPFNSSTVISYSIVREINVQITVFNVTGQKIKTLIDQRHQPDIHKIYWDGRDDQGIPVSSGIYFYRLDAESFSQTKKMILLP